MEVQRGTDGDTPSSTITLIPKLESSSHVLWLSSPVVSDLAGASKDMRTRDDVAHSFSGFYSKTKIISTCYGNKTFRPKDVSPLSFPSI